MKKAIFVVLMFVTKTMLASQSVDIKAYFDNHRSVASATSSVASKSPLIENTSAWAIYPNPVNDILTLNYKGTEPIKGVINVQITDMTGKVVVKFRAASTNKTIQIPLSSNLKAGTYAVQMIIENEMVFSSKFLKQ